MGTAVRAHAEVAGQIAQGRGFYHEASAALERLHRHVTDLANARAIERQELIASLQAPPPQAQLQPPPFQAAAYAKPPPAASHQFGAPRRSAQPGTQPFGMRCPPPHDLSIVPPSCA